VERFAKYAFEMGLGAMTFIPTLMKTGWGIQKLLGGYIDSKVIS
jgi:hypothetical protein